jgi:hypothetical protein
VVACKISVDPDQPVAIELILPDSARVEVTDTFRPRARALNGLGDSVAATIFWSSLDTAALQVLDSTTGVALAKTVTPVARLQARTGNLISNPQNVTILARLDSLLAAGSTRDTVFLTTDSLSDSLSVQAYATGGAPVSRRVVYAVTTFPASGPVVTLVPKDTVFTGSTGVAFARLRPGTGLRPDSVVVSATMRHVNGTLVQGSPVTFVVEFQP